MTSSGLSNAASKACSALRRGGLQVAVFCCRIDSPYATNGPHSVSAATTKGDLALVFIAAANDKQVRAVLLLQVPPGFGGHTCGHGMRMCSFP